MPPVSSPRPDLVLSSRSPQASKKGMAHEYRLMVDAVQAGDLAAARRAYGRMMERLSSVGVGADDTLAKIGASLSRGDLASARHVLDRLESKALTVLRGLRAHADFAFNDPTQPPPDLRKH
jgi:hypothetical protein